MLKKVKIISTEILSNYFFPLKKITFESESRGGEMGQVAREVYASTNGAVALLYNHTLATVILTRQFRLPTYINNNHSGMLLEACAGIVEQGEDPGTAIIREIEEETGYKVKEATKVFEMFMSPGSVSEMLYFYIAEYTANQKVSEGGGLEDENENIEVIELPFEEAYKKIETGDIKDAKTALLLQYAKLHLF